jgi:hypothetical protein
MSELKALIAQGEHQQLDFKFRIDDSKKIARTLCAFANSKGGRLLIGVKDNGKITGVDPNEEIHMIIAAAEMYCKPALIVESKVWQEDMKLVLDIWVPKSAERPVMAFNEEGVLRAYVRVDDSTLLANKILLGVWRRAGFSNDRPQHFGENEISLLKCFSFDEGLTLSKIYRSVNLKKKEIDALLIRFVSWKLVRMELSEAETLYFLADN